MAPECVRVYLRLNLEFQLENLNPLRPLQDLSGFQMKIEFEDIKNQQCVEKDVKQQKSRTEHCDFTKKFDASIFDKRNDSKKPVNEKLQN